MSRSGAAELSAGSRAPRRGAAAERARWPLRRPLIFAAAALCAAAVLYEGLIHTPISAVQEVRIEGVRGVDARAIDASLRTSALGMSTLAVDEGALRAAVGRFAVVRSVTAQASFPHSLRIIVTEQLPAAVVQVGSLTSAVAADGRILGARYVSGRLPRVSGSFRVSGQTLRGPHAADLLAIAAAAPAPLAAVVDGLSYGPHGVTAAMRGGLRVYFGDGALARAKWISLVRVLTAPSSHGASSIDVTVPGRPAAAFKTGAGETAGASAPLTGEALISALTAALAEGGNPAAGATSGAATTPSSEPQQQATETTGQAAPPAEAQIGAGG
ncbi:MAG TPA: FtsQ-type POTRA domain-containing protein [Solirubrobacteraceae bacterium]|nr:FtsQ-type POTRA domain-containing protein [Solirubrobacteraceae bacterium]